MAKPIVLHKNMSLDTATDYCQRNGATVRQKVGNGELVFSHFGIYEGRPCVVNGTRKGCPQPLVVFCRKLERLLAAAQQGLTSAPQQV
jgi:hypothetical protein